jgi:hypothetical protein
MSRFPDSRFVPWAGFFYGPVRLRVRGLADFVESLEQRGLWAVSCSRGRVTSPLFITLTLFGTMSFRV